jgi:hypothetical protein
MSDEISDGARAEASRILTSAKQQWPYTMTLSYPVQFGKQTIESLTFRRGQLGDLEEITLGEVPPCAKLIALAARLCGQSIKVIQMLDPDDADEVLNIALGFISRCRGAGKTSSGT